MQTLLTTLALIAFGQLGDSRYDGDGAPDTAASDTAAPDGAAVDEGAGDAAAAESEGDADPTASEITIGAETPPPALGDAVQPDADGAAAPDIAADLTAAPPAEPELADPPPATADDAATQSAEARELNPAPAAPKPADLMRALLITPEMGQLAGIPTSLGTAVRDAATRVEQTCRAQAYWDLSAAVAQYYLALQERQDLAALRQGVAAPAATWDAAAADLDKRVEFTRQSALAAQMHLHRLMGDAASAALPLPADTPHCGRYNTRYSEIFATRTDPAAAQINALLPLVHGELVAETNQVADAHAWLTFVSEHRDPATDGTGLLRSYQLMTERRRTFIETARQYNNHIAEYAELAAPDQIGPDRLVAMLIRVSTAGGGNDNESSVVQPAAAVEDATEPATENQSSTGASADDNDRPRTFAWRPFERLRNRERSIVTARRLLRLPGRSRN